MSTIQFSCPSCSAGYKVPAQAAGKQATCKSCGKSMTVPTASEGTGGGSAGNVDLAGLYSGAEAAPVAAVDGGSVFAAPPRRRGGPNPMLLIGAGGGVLVLILVVVLVVVLTGGSGDPPDPNPAPVAGVGTDTDNERGRRNRRGGTSRTNNNGDNETDTGNGEAETVTDPVDPAGDSIQTPDGALFGVADWSLEVPAEVAAFTSDVDFRGMVITLPPEWQTETQTVGQLFGDTPEVRDAIVDALGDEVLETAVLTARPRESLTEVEMTVLVSRTAEHDEWPQFRDVDRITGDMLGLSGVDTRQIAESSGGDSSAAFELALLQAMAQGFDQVPLAFNFLKPDTYFLKSGTFEDVRFGTLFGGHPFARTILRNTSEGTLILLYAGYVGHVQVTFIAEAPAIYDELINDMDWVVRSARLMTSREARGYARGDTTYAMWMNDRFVRVAFAESDAPFAGQTADTWPGFGERSLFQQTALAATVTPYRQPYGIVPPEGMRLASTNRVAARWFPNNNGMWLQLKVTKLEGRAQRTMTSPILEPAETNGPERLFVYSTIQPLPAGYELSEVQAGGVTLHRVLLPEMPGHDTRKVFYIGFDGGDQVTIEGHFNKNRPEDLERLDAAAKSLTRI